MKTLTMKEILDIHEIYDEDNQIWLSNLTAKLDYVTREGITTISEFCQWIGY